MSRRPVRSIALCLAVFLVLGALLAVLQNHVALARKDLLTTTDLSARERLIELSSTVMLGSFRPVAVDLLWCRATMLQQEREWAELKGIIEMIAKVQPTDIQAYIFQVWNMAYNIQYNAPTVVEAWRWVNDALDFGKRGIARNLNHPEIWELYWQIAWVYAHRCASVNDKRTDYFEEQVRKQYGKSPYLVAAEWYEKAFEAAARPGVRSVNVAYMMMWPNAYANLARIEEKNNHRAQARLYRETAIRIHQRIMDTFPKYRRFGEEFIDGPDGLRALIRVEERWAYADELRKQKRTSEEVAVREEVAQAWNARFDNAAIPQAPIQLDRATDELESAVQAVADPKERRAADLKVLELRWRAADPGRGSAEAVNKLEATIKPYDRQLETMSTTELRNDVPLVQMSAWVWARIIANSTAERDADRGRQAETAVRRYDVVVHELLPPAGRPAHLSPLTDCWVALLTHTGLDLPLGRARVAAAALAHETELRPRLQQSIQRLQELKRVLASGAPPAQQQQAAAMALESMPEIWEAVSYTVRLWSTLLKKDPAFAQDAKTAETHLRSVAEALEGVATVAQAMLLDRALPEQFDPRALAQAARTIWRKLYEFDPANTLYLQKSREPARKVPVLQDHDHDHED